MMWGFAFERTKNTNFPANIYVFKMGFQLNFGFKTKKSTRMDRTQNSTFAAVKVFKKSPPA